MVKYGLLLSACLADTLVLSAQPKYGTLAGSVSTPMSVDGTMTSVEGAVVEARTVRDTLYTTTVRGAFLFRRIAAGRVTLHFSHVSYNDVVREVEIVPGQTTQAYVTMHEASNEMEAVSVKGEIPVLTVKGDTLVYNPAAVRTLEGDETMAIIGQLPGMQVSTQAVSVMGVDIARTYIDGKLVFGSDPMAALQNLLADDVVKIRVYDEYVEQDPEHKRRKGDQTRRVFNIETRSKPIQAATGHFLASYGADMNRGGRDRYGIGATANFFSENLLLSTNVFFNNLNRKSNKIADIIAVQSPKSSYDRTTYANAGAEKNWKNVRYEGAETTLKASYTYGDDYSRSENRTQQTYFPSAEYDSRLYGDTVRNDRTTRYHAATVGFSSSRLFLFDHRMRFADEWSDGSRSYASIVDGGAPVGGRTRHFDKRSTPYDISDKLSIRHRNFNVAATFDASNSDGRGFRTDTLTSTATRRELRSSSDGLSRKATVDVSTGINLSQEKASKLEFGYSFVWDKSRRKQTWLDLSDAQHALIDTTNTYDFTNDYTTHKATVELNLCFPNIGGNLGVKSDFSTTRINRDERFPEDGRYDKRFDAFLPSVYFSLNRLTGLFVLTYMTSTRLPSVEQLRPRLNDANPYMLVGGNQRLRQSYTHAIIGQFTTLFGKANNSLSILLNIRETDRLIAVKRRFFTAKTLLPEWNYLAPAQSTLTTYENVNGLWQIDGSVRLVLPLRKLRSQLGLDVLFVYNDTPSFVDEALNRTRNYAPELKLNLRVDASRTFRLTVGARSSYIYSRNTVGQDDRYFQQGAWANTRLIDICKYFYVDATYSLSYYRRYGSNGYDLNNQILNLAVGCKFFKRRGDLSFTAYDLLNRNSGYKTAMYSDYVQNTWTRSFGRYFTFNIAYKFNKSWSGVPNRSVKDGSVEK